MAVRHASPGLPRTRGASASGWTAQRRWAPGTTNTGIITTETTGAASALSVMDHEASQCHAAVFVLVARELGAQARDVRRLCDVRVPGTPAPHIQVGVSQALRILDHDSIAPGPEACCDPPTERS